MARTKESERPVNKWNFDAPGVRVYDEQEDFVASVGDAKVNLSITYRQVDFNDMDAAIDFFGGSHDAKKALEEYANETLQLAEKSTARNFEVRVNRLYEEQVILLERKKERELTEDEKSIVRTRCRERLIELDNIAKSLIEI